MTYIFVQHDTGRSAKAWGEFYRKREDGATQSCLIGILTLSLSSTLETGEAVFETEKGWR